MTSEAIAPQEPSSLAAVPPIVPQAPLLSEAAQLNESSSAAEMTQDEPLEPEDLDVLEGIQEEDVSFGAVENIASDVNQQRCQDCEQTKLELIKSSNNITCKSGGKELVLTVVSNSIPESPFIEFQNIGIQEMD